MITIDPKQGAIHEFNLAERSRRKSSSQETMHSKVALTEPVVLTLDKSLIGDDLQLLAEYTQLAKTYRHYYISLNCSFDPRENERFESAEISIKLDADSMPKPVVHSMRPSKLSDKTKIKTVASIGVDFLFNSELGAEEEVEKSDYFLRTFLNGPKAYWLFQRTKASEIEGSYPLQFIVRVPNSYDGITGEVNLSVKAGDKRFWIFWQDEKAAKPEGIPFLLGK